MHCMSSIFERFEPRGLTSDVIGHVLPRAATGGIVFSDPNAATLPPLRTTLPSITKTQTSPHVARPAPVAPPQTPLEYLMEASLSRRMNNVAVCTRRASPASQEPTQSESVCSFECSATTQPLKSSRAVASVKTIQITAPGAPKPKRKRIRIKTPRRREQCRTNQARYRKKQAEYAKTLEITVEQLRHEVQILEMQHNRLVSSAKPSAWHVVAQYFHLFRNGTRRPDEISSGPEAWLQKSEAEQQLVFLRSSMAENVMIGEQRGVDAVVEQWKRYTSYFDDLQFQLEHMTKVSEDFISATASLNVTISDSTLQHVFPHLLVSVGDRPNGTQEHKTAILRSNLLGQQLFLPCRLSFEWDEVSNRIVRISNTVDFLPSLMQVLGSLEDVALALKQALLHAGRCHAPLQLPVEQM